MTGVRLALIGDPVSHSVSPLIHGHWLAVHGIAGRYDALRIPENLLAQSVRDLIGQGVRGLNVTLPHKETILGLCTRIHDSAKLIGAANTLVIDDNAHVTAHNTDMYGFAENLWAEAPDFAYDNASALIIGAGGGARAVVHALRALGVKTLILTNRTPERAQRLADETGAHTHPWAERESALSAVQIVVNTSTLGMAGQPPLDVGLEGLPPRSLVADIVYKPLWTPLLREARARGHLAVTGIGMLLYQAQQAFHLWTGQWPVVDDHLRNRVMPS